MPEAQQVGTLFKPTQDDLWKVFRSVHDYPSELPDIAAESGVSIGRLYTSLARLEEDGLVKIVGELPLIWRLAHAA